LVGIIAKGKRLENTLVSHIPFVDYHIPKTARNASKNGKTQKEVKKHTEKRQ